MKVQTGAGDGFFATFDGPARAVRCACSVRDEIRALGLQIRAGVHTGECEIVGDKRRASGACSPPRALTEA